VTRSEELELLRMAREIHAAVCGKGRIGGPVPASTAEPQREPDASPIAADGELDRTGGDPVVRILPRSYSGPDVRGQRFSMLEPRLLGAIAHLLEWRAQKNRGEGKTKWALQDARDAALARGWRRRLETQVDNGANPDEEPWL